MINIEREGLLGDNFFLSKDFVEPLCTNEFDYDKNGVAHGQHEYLDTCLEEEDKEKNWICLTMMILIRHIKIIFIIFVPRMT